MTPLAASALTWLFILLPLIIIWALGLVDIVRRDLSRQTKAGWIVIVLLLPVVGTLVYFLMRKPTESEIRTSRDASQDPGRRVSRTAGRRPPVE